MKLNTTVKFVSITLLSTLLFACNSGSSNGSNNSTSPSSFKAVTDVSFSSKNGLAIESDSWSLVGGASMPDGEAWSVATDNGVVYVGSGKSGNVYSSTNGGDWQTVGGGRMPDGGGAYSTAIYNGVVYAENSNGSIWFNSNNGNWTQFIGEVPGYSSDNTLWTMAISSTGEIVVGGDTDKVWQAQLPKTP